MAEPGRPAFVVIVMGAAIAAWTVVATYLRLIALSRRIK
jgi:hypothetical protein